MRLEILLRLAVAGAFVGHGAYGAILARSSWFDYFAVLGIDQATVSRYALMQVVGWLEIGLGLLALVLPIPAVLLAMFVWQVSTELLRPAAGELIWEFVERASNMLAPLALRVVVRNGKRHSVQSCGRPVEGNGTANHPSAGRSPQPARRWWSSNT
jgi:hypothetical protein